MIKSSHGLESRAQLIGSSKLAGPLELLIVVINAAYFAQLTAINFSNETSSQYGC